MRDHKQNSEGRLVKKYRNVSELRIAYLCEHRYHLLKRIGDTSSEASRQGTRLHSQVSHAPIQSGGTDTIMKILIIILTLVAGIFWILS